MLSLTESLSRTLPHSGQNASYFTFFSELRYSHWSVTMIETVVLLIIFMVSLVGNLGALLLVTQEKRLTNSSLLTLNLFLADLLFVCTVPLVITVRWTKAWSLGPVVCHMIMYFISLSGIVGISTLAAISIERLLAILKMETKPNLNLKWATGALILIWLISAAALCPISLFSRVVPVSSRQQDEIFICTIVWPHLTGEIVWNVIFIALGFLVPGTCIVINYSKIYQVRQRSKRRLHASTSLTHIQSRAVSQQDYKLFRTLLILMMSFFTMWTPIFIFTLLILVHNFRVHVHITSSMFFWVVAFTMANSALNPVLYSVWHLKHTWKKFCSAIRFKKDQRRT